MIKFGFLKVGKDNKKIRKKARKRVEKSKLAQNVITMRPCLKHTILSCVVSNCTMYSARNVHLEGPFVGCDSSTVTRTIKRTLKPHAFTLIIYSTCPSKFSNPFFSHSCFHTLLPPQNGSGTIFHSVFSIQTLFFPFDPLFTSSFLFYYIFINIIIYIQI